MVLWGRNLVIDATWAVVVLLTEYFWLVVVAQDVHQATPIPVVGHTTTVVDVPCSVFQHLDKNVSLANQLRAWRINHLHNLIYVRARIIFLKIIPNNSCLICDLTRKLVGNKITVRIRQSMQAAALGTHFDTSTYLVRNVFVFKQEHFELTYANTQVAVCELVRNVETQGTKLSSLDQHSME